jgi:serine/threonine protein kinase
MARHNSLVGQCLGSYEIQEELGSGGMATIYKAWHAALQRQVALKVLSPHLLSDEEFVRRFQREAIAAAAFKHPNIVAIYDVAQQGNYYYIVMEYVEGRSLDKIIAEEGALPLDRVLHIVEQIGTALDYIHQNELIHRDIKPANIIIKPDGSAVLSDFGIVKMQRGTGDTGPLTQFGMVMGTPAYMSPEQIEGLQIDYRTDLYSLGIVCYEMLSGRTPFVGTTTAALLNAQLNKLPPPIIEINHSLPPHIDAAINRMLAKNPETRFQSARAFVEALRGQQGAPTPSPVEPQPEVATAATVPKVDSSAETKLYRPSELPGAATSRLDASPGPPQPLPAAEPPAGPSPSDVSAQPPRRWTLAKLWPFALGGIALFAMVAVVVTVAIILSGPSPTETPTSEEAILPPGPGTPTATHTPESGPGTPTPTKPPTPKVIPEATPTPRRLASPQLLLPANNAVFAGEDSILSLSWSDVAELEQNEYYVVFIRSKKQEAVAEFWRKETTLEIDAALLVERASLPDNEYNWEVLIMRCTDGCAQVLNDDARKTGSGISNPSDQWTFYWYPSRSPKGIAEN